MIKRLILFSLIGMVAMSCSSGGFLTTADVQRQEGPVDSAGVAVFATEDAGAPYDELGSVIISSPTLDAQSTVARLKTEAAKLGADAIVNLKLRYAHGHWGLGLEARGKAVKLNP